MSALSAEQAMGRVSQRGHEMGAFEMVTEAACGSGSGWRDLWQARCLYCGRALTVYHGLVAPEQSDDDLLQPCVAAERLAAWRAEQGGRR